MEDAELRSFILNLQMNTNSRAAHLASEIPLSSPH